MPGNGVRALVTSRAPLRVAGEQEYRLEPLPVTKPPRSSPSGHARSGERSSSTPRSRRSAGASTGSLAVELAAARTSSRSRAPPRTPRLGSSPPDGRRPDARAPAHPPRDDRVGYDLLDSSAQELFGASRCSQAASRSTLQRHLRRRPRRPGALVDYSLLKTVGDDRFLMLETIREYALERLVDAGGELRRRHAQYFAAVAEEACVRRFDAEAEWSARLDVDHDDLNGPRLAGNARRRRRRRALRSTRLVLALPRAARGGRGRLSDALSDVRRE